ncbi:methyl-accepting chemotaxis protein [Paenibacillus herberti]|nr:methyl-accepting chemotaxis protein [Paenibacillus herberti]
MLNKLYSSLKDSWKRLSRANGQKGRDDSGSSKAMPDGGSDGRRKPVTLGMKLFLTVFASILICVLAMGQLSYLISKSIIEEQATKSSSQTIKQLSEKLELIFGRFDDISMQFVSDTTLQNMISSTLYASDEAEALKAQRELNNKLQNMVLGMDGVENLNLIPLRESLGDTVIGTGKLDKAKLEQKEWYKAALEAQSQTVWIPTQPLGFQDGGKPTIGLARPLKEPGGNEAVYLLLVEIQDSALQNQIKGAELGEGSSISILDSNDRILLDSTGRGMIGKESRVKLTGTMNEKLDGALLTENAGGDVLVIYKSFPANGWILSSVQPVSVLVHAADAIYRLTFIVSAIAGVLAVLIGLFVMRLVGRPLNRLRSLMQRGKDGDLTVRAEARSGDVIGKTEHSFNEMMEQITGLVTEARTGAEQVLGTAAELGGVSRRTAEAAREIATASEEIAGGASSLATEAERGSDLTMDMSRSMEQLKQSNSQMSGTAQQVETSSKLGSEYMVQLVQKTAQTEAMTSNMAKQIESLQESTRSIRKILDVLGGVAKQTNILSLNASIEAARAGVAGKGFMVVAAEIRQLAEQSKQSIGMVEEITGRIQQQMDETVASLAAARPIFQEQIESVKDTSQIFLEVQGRMAEFGHSLQSVGSAVQLLDEVHSQLSGAMTSVSAVAEQSSATSEEVASLTQEQQGVSQGLVELSSNLEGVSRSLQLALARFQTEQY